MSFSQKTLNNISYQVFLVGITLLAVANTAVIFLLGNKQIATVLAWMDATLTPFFLLDFVLRVLAAPSRRRYFFRQFGWVDLLGSLWLPGLDFLRIFRIPRAVTIIRSMPGTHEGRPLRAFRRELANSVLGTMLLLAFLVLEIGGVAVLHFESANPNANITTPGDALWWGIVTIATVGYGDKYPITPGGRVVGTFEIITGVAVFSTISGFLANAFINSRRKEADQQQLEDAANRQDLLAEVRRLVAEHAGRADALEARLARIESLLVQAGRNEPAAGPSDGAPPEPDVDLPGPGAGS